MNKSSWNIRIYQRDDESETEILPLTLAIVEDMPDFSGNYEDEDDDPRSLIIHLSWNSRLDKERYQAFENWIVESLSPDAARKIVGKKRKKPKHCSAVMAQGQQTRYLNYVYLEEIHYTHLDYIDLGLREAKAIIDYRSMTEVPIQVSGTKLEER